MGVNESKPLSTVHQILLDFNTKRDLRIKLLEHFLKYTNHVYLNLLSNDNLSKYDFDKTSQNPLDKIDFDQLETSEAETSEAETSKVLSESYLISEQMIPSFNNPLLNIVFEDAQIRELFTKNPYLFSAYMKSYLMKITAYMHLCNTQNNFTVTQNNINNAVQESECNICCIEYKKDEKKMNKNQIIFNCGHSCCSSCMDQIIKSNLNKHHISKHHQEIFKCHTCRIILQKKRCQKLHLLVNKLNIQTAPCCIDGYLEKILKDQQNLNFQFMFEHINILFYLPFIVDNVEMFNHKLLTFIEKNISKMHDNTIVILAARYYLIFNSNFNFKNTSIDNIFDKIYLNGLYFGKKINIDILSTLIYSPNLLLKFLHVLYIIFNSENIEYYSEYQTYSINLNNIPVEFFVKLHKSNSPITENNLIPSKMFDFFNNSSKKRILNMIIDKFHVNQKTCIEFFKNRIFFNKFFNSIKNKSIFSNLMRKDSKNPYYLLLTQLRFREVININSGYLELKPQSSSNNMFLFLYKNIEFCISASNLEQSFLEAKFFLFLNKDKLQLNQDEIMKSTNTEYKIRELNKCIVFSGST